MSLSGCSWLKRGESVFLLCLKGAAVNFNMGDKYANTQVKVKVKVTAGRV